MFEIPTGTTTAARFARELSLLLGPAHGNAPKDSNRADDLAALGYALAYAWQRQRDAVAEAHPRTASELVAELEGEFGIVPESWSTLAERRAALTAKARARFEGTPDALTLSAHAFSSTAVIREILANRVAHTDPRAAFRIVVVIPESDYAELDRMGFTRARLYRVLRQQVPAYVHVSITTRLSGFLCDDPDSVTNRDALRS